MNRSAKPYFLLALAGLGATSAIGLLACLHLDQPISLPGLDYISFARLRPLHTLLALASAFAGIFALARLPQPTEATPSHPASKLQLLGLVAFILAALASIATGHGSGREYFSWHPAASAPLLLAVALHASRLYRHRRAFAKISPEGLWLVATGAGFLCLSLLESCLWLLPRIGLNAVVDLTVQWHAIDALFAGINLSLYGASLFLLDKKARPLRPKPLFLLALGSLLFTFGHHHYASPQPTWLKVLALLASLLAISSFIRHSRAYLRRRDKPDSLSASFPAQLVRSIQIWTIVSLLSGILYAIPQINLYLHGTLLVLIHAMGSMIGICLIIYLGAFQAGRPLSPADALRAGRRLRLVNASLSGLWLVLGVGGIYRGTARLHLDYLEFAPHLRWANLGFLLCGAALFLGIALLSASAARALLAVPASETAAAKKTQPSEPILT